MKKVSIFSLAAVCLLGAASCKKQTASEEAIASSSEIKNALPNAALACNTKYLDLVVDAGGGGGSFLYRIDNTPSNPPFGNTALGQIGAVTFMTGLSYDPATGICYGITGNAGSNPNSIIRFNLATPAIVGITPLISTGGAINLTDIELNPAFGRYYAINRAAANNNRIVIVDVNTGVVTFLPLTTGLPLRGLAMDPGGKIYVMRMTGTSGNVYVVDPGTGGIILGPCAYPGVISPGVLGANAEMGLHFDDVCSQRLVTGNFTGTNFQLTDGLPACLGGPLYAVIVNAIKPTVDFSRLN
jgi:hypothetical protein